MQYKIANVISLGREICLPEDILSQIQAAWQSIDTEAMLPHIMPLTKPETTQAAYDALKELFAGNDPNGIKMLTSQLLAALYTREIYAQKGIGGDIFISTIKSLSRFVNEHMESYGYYGFDRGWWTYRHLAAQIFRLGVLEFEVYNDTLFVHIPSDAVMTAESLAHSYGMAKSFFAKQGVEYTGIFCRTWLLYPALQEILPPNSRILTFQKDYEILELHPESKSVMRWVFKKDYDDLTQLPETTSLQRNLKKLLLAGGNIGDAYGRYKGE